MYFDREIDSLDLSKINGNILVIGGIDSGKSTFSYELFLKLQKIKDSAILDIDIGQSAIGYPSIQTLKYKNFIKEWFIGSFSPVGNFLDFIIGAKRLSEEAVKNGAKSTVVDTTGFIDEKYGATFLKHSLIEILNSKFIIALQRENELENILYPYEKSKRVEVFRFKVPKDIKNRSKDVRRKRKVQKLKEYFKDFSIKETAIDDFAIIGKYPLVENQLIAFLNKDGFLVSLAIVIKMNNKGLILKTTKCIDNSCMIKTSKIVLDKDFNYSFL